MGQLLFCFGKNRNLCYTIHLMKYGGVCRAETEMNQSKGTGKQLESGIRELIDCGALELLRCLEGNPNDMYIPYMMNDALEDYFILTECTAVGELKTEFPRGTTVELVPEHQGNSLILHRPDGTLLTLQYQQAGSTAAVSIPYHRTFLAGWTGAVAAAGVYHRHDL